MHTYLLKPVLVGYLEISVTRIEAGSAMPAFFCLALTTVTVKSLLPNFPHNLLVTGQSARPGEMNHPIC